MNPVIETMLKDLIEETGQHGPGAIYAVLSMLYGCYANGSHNDFARYCCEFSSVQITGMNTTARQNPGGPADDSGNKEWVC
jgi:hypothetical protein